MFLTFYHHEQRAAHAAIRGKTSRFGHAFGGCTPYSGLAVGRGKPSIHLLLRLKTDDPAVGVKLPDAVWLPLLCAIRYGACALGYRVISDREVRILRQETRKPWSDWPGADYPVQLPVLPVAINSHSCYDPDDPEDAWVFGVIFGYDHLTLKQRSELLRFIRSSAFYDAETETPEEYLHASEVPYVQGPPQEDCPDPDCSNHGRPASLRTFAIFQEDESENGAAFCLWGSGGENLQLVYQLCPRCSAVSVTNQCT